MATLVSRWSSDNLEQPHKLHNKVACDQILFRHDLLKIMVSKISLSSFLVEITDENYKIHIKS